MLVKTSKGQLWHLDREGLQQALVLRYANCSLRCHICFAQRYAYLNPSCKGVKSSTVEQCVQNLNDLSQDAAWIRILGGEPLLDDARAEETTSLVSECLGYLANHQRTGEPRVIVQTNGLWFAKTKPDSLEKLVKSIANRLQSIGKGRAVIEVSLKGANLGDANSYALSRNSSLTSTVFPLQLEGFENLLTKVSQAWHDGIYDLAIYPVAGIGPQISKPGFIPLSTIVSGRDEEYPMFHRGTWDSPFLNLVSFFRAIMMKWHRVYGDYLEKHGSKLPMEGMSSSMFQFGWISEIEKRVELERFVSLNMKANWDNPSLNLFKTRYPFLLETIGQASQDLLAKVRDLNIDFYNSDPSLHYPYL